MPLALTVDIEWAGEDHIKAIFEMADAQDVPLFPFVTHRSAYLKKRGGPQGIHPNFLPGSTHGKTEAAVIRHCLRLVPDARAFRAHCFYDHSRLQWAMAERGITTDANALHYMSNPYPLPFQCVGGYTRYPTYWSDDVAIRRGETRIDKRRFNTTSVLVCNVHPQNASLQVVRELFEWARLRAVPFAGLIREGDK